MDRLTFRSQFAIHTWVFEEFDFLFTRIYTAPTAPVGFVNVSNVTRTSFTLHWGPVPCIHRNGIITGYLVMYGIQGTERSQSLRTTNGNVLSANIVGLLPDFVYRVEIAGVNSVGAGVSTFVDVRTSQG